MVKNKFHERINRMTLERRLYVLENLPKHLINVGKFERLEHVLTDLYFIDAKCAAGMTYELIGDFSTVLDVLPEAREDIRKRQKHENRIKRYIEEIIAYAKAWSEARVKHYTDPKTNPLPRPQDIPLPEIIPSVKRWSDEKIRKDSKRIANNPTRLDRIKAFSQFVNSESYALVKFAHVPGFCIQHAYNSAGTGTISSAAEEIIGHNKIDISLLNNKDQRQAYNPHSAMMRILEGHPDLVWHVSVTPDGRTALSACRDRKLRVWDVESGVCLRTLEGHHDSVNCVSITPDGRIAVSGSGLSSRSGISSEHDSQDKENTLRVWDIEGGECIRILEGHSDSVDYVSVTPDGRLAVSASRDKTLRVWDLESEKCLMILDGHQRGVESVSITPDCRMGVSASRDRTLRVWDIEKGECLRILEGHKDVVTEVSVTTDGKTAISASWDKTIRLWDIETGDCMKILHNNMKEVTSVQITPDGRMGVSGGWDNKLMVWDLEKGECRCILEGHSDSVESVSITPDGGKAISASRDSTLRIWNVESGISVKQLESHTGAATCTKVTPDGKKIVSTGADSTLRVWNLESGECLKILEGHTGSVDSVSITPNGRKAISASGDRTLRVWDIESGECLRILEGHTESVRCVCVTPDGRRAVSASWDRTLRIWDIESGSCLRTLLGHTDKVWCVGLTPDGRKAVSGGQENILLVWDLERGAPVKTLEGHTSWAYCVSVIPDGRRAVSAGWDNTLRVWDLNTGENIKTLEGHTDNIYDICVTLDFRKVISASRDKTLCVWDIEKGECLRVLEGHTDSVGSVSVTHDGRWAISSSGDFAVEVIELTETRRDNTLRIWDVENGECIGVYQASSEVSSLSPIQISGRFVAGFKRGEVIVVNPLNLKIGIPFVSSQRIWLYGKDENRGCWDDKITAFCPWCGKRFPVKNKILDAIRALGNDMNANYGETSYLGIPPEAWNKPELQSKCLYCYKPLRFTPFMADNRESPDAALSEETEEVIKDVVKLEAEKGLSFVTLQAHAGPVTAVALTQEGRYLMSGSADRTVKVYSTHLDLELNLSVHEDIVEAVSLFPDGKVAVSASRDGDIRLWNLEERVEVRNLRSSDPLQAVKLTKDGKKAVLAFEDRTVRIWDVIKGTEIDALSIDINRISGIAVTEDARWVAFGSKNGTFLMCDLKEGTEVLGIEGDFPVRAVGLTQDGKRAVYADEDSTIQVWDTQREEELHVLEGHTAPITALEVTVDGRQIVSVSLDGTLKVWSIGSGKLINSINVGPPLLSCAASLDGVIGIVGDVLGQLYSLKLKQVGVNSISIADILQIQKKK